MTPEEAGLAAYAVRWLMAEIAADPALAVEAAQEAAPATQENGSLPDLAALSERLLARLDRRRPGRTPRTPQAA